MPAVPTGRRACRSLPVGSAPRGAIPAAAAALCRPEVGVPLPAGPSLRLGSAPRGESSRRLGFRRRGAAGRCRPEVGRRAALVLSGVRGEGAILPSGRRSRGSSPRLFRSERTAQALQSRCGAVRVLALAGWSVIGTGFALPRDAGRRPALQSSLRLFSVCGARRSRWQDGASSERVSRSRAMPVGDRRSRPSELPHLLGVRAERGAILTGWGFGRRGAAGRCADRRSAFQAVPALLRVGGARHSRWQGAASSARVSRSRAMPVGDRRSRPSEPPHLLGYVPRGVIPPVGVWAAAALRAAVPTGGRRSKPSPRLFAIDDGSFAAVGRDAGRRPALLAFPCLQRHLGRPADLAAGLLGGGRLPGLRTPVGERTALPADRRRWKSPAAESRSRSSRWSRCSCRSSRG